MRISILATLAVLSGSLAAAQSPPSGAADRLVPVRGVLIDAGTGAVVRRARVDVIVGEPRIATVISNGRIEVMSGSSPITTVMSDDEGRFAVDVPASTQATVRVSKARYAPVTRTLSALQLRDSVPLLLALTPGAAIVGRVVDTAGEPVANVPIDVSRVGNDRSDPFPPRTIVLADQRGEFRIGGLAAGRYTVDGVGAAVMPGRRVAPLEIDVEPGDEEPVVLLLERATPSQDRLVAVLTFDPTTGAAPDRSAAGSALAASRAIRGTVTSSRGAPLSGAIVSAIRGSTRRSATTGLAGRFAIAGLLPGSYTVEAVKTGYVRSEHGQRPLELPGIKVVVGTDDVENVNVTLPPAGAVTGIVFDEFGEPLQDADVQVVRVHRSSAGLTNAEVVFSRRGATLTGGATDDRGTPVRDYALYVFSDDRDKWVAGSRWIRMARAGADGAFRIRSLPPGTYWAVAVDRVDSSVRTTDPAERALLETLVPYATAVTVGEAEARDVTLRVVRR